MALGGSQPIFAWAGLWSASAEYGNCFTGVMTSPCSELAHIHDQLPVIREPERWQQWLNSDILALKVFDKPLLAERMYIDATGQFWTRRG